MKCRFDYIDNNIKNKRFADKLTNICIQTWKELINSDLFRRKDNSLFFSKLSTINRQKQEELISLLNSKHNATIIFNNNDKVVVDVSELFSKEPIENNDLQNTDIYKSFVKRIYDNYIDSGILQYKTNDTYSDKEIDITENIENPKRIVTYIPIDKRTGLIVNEDKDILSQIEDYVDDKLLPNKYEEYLASDKAEKQTYEQYLNDNTNYTPILILPIGISGSGKSTWINNLINKDEYIIISPDEIRKELTGSIHDQSKNIEVFKLADKRMYEQLKKESPVILDATNLNTEYRRKMLNEVLDKYPNTQIYYKLLNSNPIISKQRIAKDLEIGKDRAATPDEIINKQYDLYLQTIQDLKEEPIKDFDTLINSYSQIEKLKILNNSNNEIMFIQDIKLPTLSVYDYGTQEQLEEFKIIYENLEDNKTKLAWLKFINYSPKSVLVKDVPYLFKLFPNNADERVEKLLEKVYIEQESLLYINQLKQQLSEDFDTYKPILNKLGIETIDDLYNYDDNTLLKDLCQ